MSDKKSTRVFISYARQDAPFAALLSKGLERKGWVTFRDMDSISPGESFQHAIRDAIDESSVVVCLVSPAYIESPWCQNELAIAFADRRPIIPVVVKDVQLERTPLSFLNALDLRDIDSLTSTQLSDRLEILNRSIDALAEKNPEGLGKSKQKDGGTP